MAGRTSTQKTAKKKTAAKPPKAKQATRAKGVSGGAKTTRAKAKTTRSTKSSKSSVRRGSSVLARSSKNEPLHRTAIQSLRRRAASLRTELGAMAVLGAGLLLLLSVLSHHPSDSRAGMWGDTSEAHIHNWVGPFGAAVSELFVDFLGLTAFLLPVMLGVLVFVMLGRRDRSFGFWDGTSFLGLVTSVTVMAHLLFPEVAFRGGEVRGGGFLGDVVGGGLVGWLSEPGTWIVAATAFLGASRVSFGVRYVEIGKLLVTRVWDAFRAVSSGTARGIGSRAKAVGQWREDLVEDWRHEREIRAEERAWELEERRLALEEADLERERLELDAERKGVVNGAQGGSQLDDGYSQDPAYEAEALRYMSEAGIDRGQTIADKTPLGSLAPPGAIETDTSRGSRVRLPTRTDIDPDFADDFEGPVVESLAAQTQTPAVDENRGGPKIDLPPSGLLPSEPVMTPPDSEDSGRVDSMMGAAARGVVHAELKVGAGGNDSLLAPSTRPVGTGTSETGQGSAEPTASEQNRSDPDVASAPSSSDMSPSAANIEGPGPKILAKKEQEVGAVEVGHAVSVRRKIRLLNEPFEHPALNLLELPPPERVVVDEAELEEMAERLEQTLRTFKVEGKVTNILPGPVVTMFEVEPGKGMRVAKFKNLGDDLALALRAKRIRIVAPIPGKGAVGIEVPSAKREMIYFREILASKVFRKGKAQLPLAVGKGIDGTPVTSDLAKMPHMIVAGTTGSGKSVCINTLILSLLYSRTPDEVRLVLVDPKILEFSIYEGIPHLLTPVVTEPTKAAMALKWAVEEMERRYQVLSSMNARNIVNYNERAEALQDEWDGWKASGSAKVDPPDCGRAAGEDTVCYRSKGGEPVAAPDKMPYIVIIIDELADLMMVAKKEVEASIVRIAQKARACGIHLILATQRPTSDVVTGLIKGNLPTKLALQVGTGLDSRVILDTGGAESLLGNGDGLFKSPASLEPQRIHGAFVSDEEVNRVVDYLKTQGKADYIDLTVEEPGDGEASEGVADDEKVDARYDECVQVVAREGKASTSLLQRKLGLGYNRAARIMDMMERDGVIGPQNGAKPREVFVNHHAG